MRVDNFIFHRYNKDHKLEFINEMTESELLAVPLEIVKRCLKEAGVRISPHHVAKRLCIDRNLASNNWNSDVNEIFENDHKIYISVYIQGDDIDTSQSVLFQDFFGKGEIVGYLEESFSNGYSHRLPARYYKEDKANVMKAILLSYVNNKYK